MERWHTTRMHEGTRQPPALQLFPADSQAWSSARKTTTGSGSSPASGADEVGTAFPWGLSGHAPFQRGLNCLQIETLWRRRESSPRAEPVAFFCECVDPNCSPHGLARTRRVRGGKERLDDCAGFRVDSPSGRVGIIGDLHRDAAGSAVELIVLTGLLDRKRVIAVDEVAQIVPRESRLVLRPRVSST